MKFSTELPSRMRPYETHKSLEMALFGIPQLKKLSKAVAIDSIEPVIDAIGEVLTQFDGHDLTDGDFNYLLAYQRMEGYKSAPLVFGFTCEGIMYRESGGLGRLLKKSQIMSLVETYDAATPEEKTEIQDPNKLFMFTETCGEVNTFDLGIDDIKVFPLTEDPLHELLDYPRLRTLADAIIAKRDPERRNIVDAVRWIKDGYTLSDKFEVLEESDDPITLLQEALKANLTHAHGLQRHVVKSCVKCEALRSGVMEVDAVMFFRV